MKVFELIEQLQHFNPDHEVVLMVWGESGEAEEVTNIEPYTKKELDRVLIFGS